MPKPLVILVGASGSGKTTLCEGLSKMPGFRQVVTSTSRPARNEADALAYHRADAHELLHSEDFVLPAEFAGNAYAVRRSEFQDDGLTLLMTGQPAILIQAQALCEEINRKLIVVHLRKSLEARVAGMQNRGDAPESIAARLAKDDLDRDMLRQPVKPNLIIDGYIEVDALLIKLQELRGV